ncbi:MAG: hypothetical protein J0H40_17085 [Rhizobiales bacterium]|nr:hypothetical protein [Hyphomicrobiales bacterium]
MRRHPNTRIWRRVVVTFKMTTGTKWRRCAALALGVQKTQLRASIDRTDLTLDQVDEINARLVRQLRGYSDWMTKKAHAAERTAREFDHPWVPDPPPLDPSMPLSPFGVMLKELLDSIAEDA